LFVSFPNLTLECIKSIVPNHRLSILAIDLWVPVIRPVRLVDCSLEECLSSWLVDGHFCGEIEPACCEMRRRRRLEISTKLDITVGDVGARYDVVANAERRGTQRPGVVRTDTRYDRDDDPAKRPLLDSALATDR
jgi:hypothetical protein